MGLKMNLNDLIAQGWEQTRYRIMDRIILIRGDDRAYYHPKTENIIYKYNLCFKQV